VGGYGQQENGKSKRFQGHTSPPELTGENTREEAEKFIGLSRFFSQSMGSDSAREITFGKLRAGTLSDRLGD
jgi:hypothetical protein